MQLQNEVQANGIELQLAIGNAGWRKHVLWTGLRDRDLGFGPSLWRSCCPSLPDSIGRFPSSQTYKQPMSAPTPPEGSAGVSEKNAGRGQLWPRVSRSLFVFAKDVLLDTFSTELRNIHNFRFLIVLDQQCTVEVMDHISFENGKI